MPHHTQGVPYGFVVLSNVCAEAEHMTRMPTVESYNHGDIVGG